MQSKLEIHFHEHVLIMIVIIKKLLELFMKMNCKKQTNKNLGIKKLLKKRKNYVSNGKVIIAHLSLD